MSQTKMHRYRIASPFLHHHHIPVLAWRHIPVPCIFPRHLYRKRKTFAILIGESSFQRVIEVPDAFRHRAIRSSYSRLAVVSLLIMGLCILTSCDSCSRKKTVPFKRDAGSNRNTRPSDDPSTNQDTSLPNRSVKLKTSDSYLQKTQKITINDAVIKIENGSIRSSLKIDLDSDGNQDVLLVTTDSKGNIDFKSAQRQPHHFLPIRHHIQLQEAVPGCEIDQAPIQAFGTEYATVSLTFTCSGERTATDSDQRTSIATETEKSKQEDPPQVPKPPPDIQVWIFSLETTPRLQQQIAVLPGVKGQADGVIDVDLKSFDQDEDGHQDILMEIGYTEHSSAGRTTIPIVWLNRPGGLALEPEQPEQTLLTVANQAQRLFTHRHPEEALKKAVLVKRIHSVLCRQSSAARLRISDTIGLNCGRSIALGRAFAVLVSAYQTKGLTIEALEAYGSLDSPLVQLTGQDRRLADRSLQSIPTIKGVEWQTGPRYKPITGPVVRLPSIAFLDENTLLLRGPTPKKYHLVERSISPAERDYGSVLITDHSKRFAIVDIFRNCDGYHLKIVNTSQVITGLVMGPTVSEPLITTRPNKYKTDCLRSRNDIKHDEGGFQVLGWDLRGAVLAYKSQLRLLPLDINAQPLANASTLNEVNPLRTPLPPGMATPNGRIFASLSPLGVIMQITTSPHRTYLIRPPDWQLNSTSDLCISPSGKKIAFIRDGLIHIAQL